MSWQEYKPSDRIQAQRDTFDKETRNTNIMILVAISLIIGAIGYSIYFDEVQRDTIVTLTSQLEECQLNSQPK